MVLFAIHTLLFLKEDLFDEKNSLKIMATVKKVRFLLMIYTL